MRRANTAAWSSGVAAATTLPPFGRFAVPCGDDTASIDDKRYQRCDVDVLEAGFDDEVDMSRCQQAVAVAVQSIADGQRLVAHRRPLPAEILAHAGEQVG